MVCKKMVDTCYYIGLLDLTEIDIGTVGYSVSTERST